MAALLERHARRCCPVIKQLGVSYHWSIMQIEYATDIVFRNRDALAPLYEAITRTAIHAVKPEQVATFLGRLSRLLRSSVTLLTPLDGSRGGVRRPPSTGRAMTAPRSAVEEPAGTSWPIALARDALHAEALELHTEERVRGVPGAAPWLAGTPRQPASAAR